MVIWNQTQNISKVWFISSTLDSIWHKVGTLWPQGIQPPAERGQSKRGEDLEGLSSQWDYSIGRQADKQISLKKPVLQPFSGCSRPSSLRLPQNFDLGVCFRLNTIQENLGLCFQHFRLATSCFATFHGLLPTNTERRALVMARLVNGFVCLQIFTEHASMIIFLFH